ncbi:hypothetical protein [Constantimarinum furrinae]|uniref:Uncharacterized protein n=1 Tax=Constantimarinum furrinae TaxID=2562285 RepID=A0A7G8PS40_9FLAO|nr:hypothetical protein [Constantimarinum furrinae]QNJ97156.1 hypothetical protein ALE3EI_0578 [Constantimarinum furrinae]
MFTKANIVSTLVTAVWGFGGGYLLWGILGDPLLSDHLGSATGVMREMPDMFHLVLGCIIQAFAFSTIYGRWANSEYGMGTGITFGFWVAILMGLGEGLIDYATSNIIDMSGTFINFGIYLVFFLVTGLLAGLVYKKV